MHVLTLAHFPEIQPVATKQSAQKCFDGRKRTCNTSRQRNATAGCGRPSRITCKSNTTREKIMVPCVQPRKKNYASQTGFKLQLYGSGCRGPTEPAAIIGSLPLENVLSLSQFCDTEMSTGRYNEHTQTGSMLQLQTTAAPAAAGRRNRLHSKSCAITWYTMNDAKHTQF